MMMKTVIGSLQLFLIPSVRKLLAVANGNSMQGSIDGVFRLLTKVCRPNKPNPLYKGKWYPPTIDNPAYIGEWSPRKISNPDFFEDLDPIKKLEKIVRTLTNVRVLPFSVSYRAVLGSNYGQ
jgi:Calreticulin family